MELFPDHLRYLTHLAKEFPSQETAAEAIINLQAQLKLPKGTEHFISDIHGEYEAFCKVVNHASGAIQRKIDEIFKDTLSGEDKIKLGALIYTPETMLGIMLPVADEQKQWYQRTLLRLTYVLRAVSSKYPRTKVRQLIEGRFERLVEELLYENENLNDKSEYYQGLIETIVSTGHAKAFIVVMAKAIQRLAIDHLHVVGDIYDRGPAAHLIVDRLMDYHSVDVQWGNHDILWMGAAGGSEACIASVIRISLRHANMETLENGYAVSLLPLASFAIETYGNDPCELFVQQRFNQQDDSEGEQMLMARMHKAITIIQFKLEAQIIRRCPEYQLEDRLLLDKIDFEKGTIEIDRQVYPLLDRKFQTVTPEDPYALTPAEQHVVDRLKVAFLHSEKLQEHARFLFANGSIYKTCNGNLLYHGCIPMNDDGSFKSLSLGHATSSGADLMDTFTRLARQGFFASEDSTEKQQGLDAMWYLWCGPCSPLFGKGKMTTFEQYFIEDKATHKEPRNIYYSLRDDETTVRRILEAFGLASDQGHVINGHVPVIVKKKERPLKAGGKLIVIDGGFSRAYQQKTGIAGYTLVFNSWGLLLATHQQGEVNSSTRSDIPAIDCMTEILEQRNHRIRIKDTDLGQEIKQRIDELMALHDAYRTGTFLSRH
ncbi:fructose-1,6-bisphosphatase [Desulforhopalus sp. IMCC35007]|uniref:fructose-1,6-bisphosphatase n=1 Tax=Desulforhopalus sp. IMCC35007 TaxID=2569543 RepID=UPI0010ADDCBD|nr:fructose-1,6-bisphosphatase [Desulforhopalus sp. IMCC35007]TKB09626.1 fructose-1,6-bisphosphatase [Desulforhopalus sp. IMCC35007]